jgi:hypothetical protein
MRKGIQGANQRVCLGAKAEAMQEDARQSVKCRGGVLDGSDVRSTTLGKGKGTVPPKVRQDDTDYDVALILSSRAS